jgi:hypothetical protein
VGNFLCHKDYIGSDKILYISDKNNSNLFLENTGEYLQQIGNAAVASICAIPVHKIGGAKYLIIEACLLNINTEYPYFVEKESFIGESGLTTVGYRTSSFSSTNNYTIFAFKVQGDIDYITIQFFQGSRLRIKYMSLIF